MGSALRSKLIIAGDSCVGKSALTQVFHSDGSQYPRNYTMTVGVELVVKAVHIPETQDAVELYIFDSAGKEVFYDLVHKDWELPGLMMVVYDCTNETSFNSCIKWIERIRSQKPEMDIPGVLVANKTDMDDRRVVSPKSGRDFAEQNRLEYFEVSAKDQKDVEAPFFYLANEFYKLYKDREDVTSSLVL